MPQPKTGRRLAPRGHLTTIQLNGRATEAHVAVHHSGSGPEVLLLADAAGLDTGLQARSSLFGEEGYSVLALGGAEAARKVLDETRPSNIFMQEA